MEQSPQAQPSGKVSIGAILAGIMFYGYVGGFMLAVPYYNWQYANREGFVKWLFLGEIAATAQAFGWPFDLYRHFSSGGSSELLKMTDDETKLLTSALEASTQRALTEEDLSSFRQAFQSYTSRTGRYLSKVEQGQFLAALTVSADYQYELTKSALLSWDSKTETTTAAYDTLRQQVSGGRSEEQLENDQRVIKAAAENSSVLTDRGGKKYEFGRDFIASKHRAAEQSKANNDLLKQALADFVR